MNDDLRNHSLSFIKKGLRFDGRKLDELRKASLEYSVAKGAEGSARVKIGETEVIVGIKMSVEKPYPDRPEEGTMMVGAELLPLSNPDFELGPPDIKSIELARVVDRGIRESQAIDTKQLLIEKGEKAWIVMIDICTINDTGNLLDASALATLAALKDAKFPAYDGEVIDYKTKTDKSIPLVKFPIAVTVYRIGDNLIIDPTSEEEKIIDARLTVTTTHDGTICALQKGGDYTLTIEEVDKMVDLALAKASELRTLL